MTEPTKRTEAEIDADIEAARRHPDWSLAFALGEEAAERKGLKGELARFAAANFAVGYLSANGTAHDRGAAAECERMRAIFDLRGTSVIGFHDAMIYAAMYDGHSQAGEVAAKILAADLRIAKLPN